MVVARPKHVLQTSFVMCHHFHKNNSINGKTYDCSCISSYMGTCDVFQVLKLHSSAASVEFDKIMFCFNNNNNNNNNSKSNSNSIRYHNSFGITCNLGEGTLCSLRRLYLFSFFGGEFEPSGWSSTDKKWVKAFKILQSCLCKGSLKETGRNKAALVATI